jgi:acetyl esterase/lipase
MLPSPVSYGNHAHQIADLHLPVDQTRASPVVCLLHGGFWRMPYGRDEMNAVAQDLAERGFAVWNMEYRRVGDGGGWPVTMEDVRAGIDHLATIARDGASLDLERVGVVGHSAGGQLALCCARDDKGRVPVHAVAGLAPVADLAYTHALSAGGGAVAAFIGGGPDEEPQRYRSASPIERLPLGIRQLVLHGTADDVLPVDVSRRYARAAQSVGDTLEYFELDGSGHMEFLDPGSHAHEVLCAWLLRTLAN